jgi:crotonobetainyl-CoA:carnitine CoA-transferase CaiB-like acyl-CoA transferase
MNPLAGFRVVDFSQNVAGPFCTQILVDTGADVVRVERPGRGEVLEEFGLGRDEIARLQRRKVIEAR